MNRLHTMNSTHHCKTGRNPESVRSYTILDVEIGQQTIKYNACMKSCMDFVQTLNAPYEKHFELPVASSTHVMLFRCGVGYDLTS